MKEVMFFSNGNSAVFEDGQQLATLQYPWILLFAEFLEKNGVDPTALSNVTMPGGYRVRFFRTTDGGLNWASIEDLDAINKLNRREGE